MVRRRAAYRGSVLSSPATTVNALMQWLAGLFRLLLPTLPLSGVWSRFTALWELPIIGSLPDPSKPLPWKIPVEPDWSMPVQGVRLVPSDISILVSPSGGPADILVPPARSRKKKGGLQKKKHGPTKKRRSPKKKSGGQKRRSSK